MRSASTHKLGQVTPHIKKGIRDILVNQIQKSKHDTKTVGKTKSVTLVRTLQIILE